jgi:hypothetical protein
MMIDDSITSMVLHKVEISSSSHFLALYVVCLHRDLYMYVHVRVLG